MITAAALSLAGGLILTAWAVCRAVGIGNRSGPTPPSTVRECPETVDEFLQKLRDARRDVPYDYEIDGF